jgi:hypothetical protein
MPNYTINYLAILIAAVVSMFIGMFWYSQMLFGKTWMAAIGKTEEDIKKASTGPLYVINTVANLILAYVLAWATRYAGAVNAIDGAKIGIWVWLGFVVTTLLPVYLFEMRPIKTYFIYIGYQLISLIIMGIILAIWV